MAECRELPLYLCHFTSTHSHLVLLNQSNILLHKDLSKSSVLLTLCWLDLSFIGPAALSILLRWFPGGFNREQ